MSLETKISPESLLQIPLIKAAIEDRGFKKIFRGIDQGWKEDGIIPVSISGFNPYESTGFIAKKSPLAQWLKNPFESIRPLNSSDALVKQALFFAHDYLHAWAISAIRELASTDFSYGIDAINDKNSEDYVFCHLLTEAVATVGLDYWFLSQIKLNDICPVGTRVRCLTIGYHSDYDQEISRFNPEMKIDDPNFFNFMARFYCDGIFSGFTVDDLKKSPILMSWIDHEVMYGEKQREYARLWFSHLSKEGPAPARKKSGAPLKVKKDWQKKLISELGESLWAFVKNPTGITESFDGSRLWRYADGRAPDPRFSNLFHHDLKSMVKSASRGSDQEEKLNYLLYQYVSQYDQTECSLKLQSAAAEWIGKKDLKSLERGFKNQSKVSRSLENEPKHIMLLN
jgi:hypothetical protein